MSDGNTIFHDSRLAWPETANIFRCGCRLWSNDQGIKFRYCKMHRAAPELLEVCKRLMRGRDFESQELRIQAVITKAEGGAG